MEKISEKVIRWYHHHSRDLPWRNTASPYCIWLSEIILQQTRVNQGLSYYNKFVAQYPNLESLASAPLDEVMKLWQGLGYYTRARNMHETARTIVRDFGGKFPSTYKDLIRLKGIGPYTAAAIASFAFKEAVAVVDGNVFRVLSRLFEEKLPTDTVSGKKAFEKLATSIMDPKNPDIHNQAVMELGSLVCLPLNPLCDQCPLQDVCGAFATGTVRRYPVKRSSKISRIRYFTYLFIRRQNATYIYQRTQKDIWHSLYDFPVIESTKQLSIKDILTSEDWKYLHRGKDYRIKKMSKTYKHLLTHQTIYAQFLEIETDEIHMPKIYREVDLSLLSEFAFSRLAVRFLEDSNLYA